MSEQTANLCTTDAAEAMRETIADQAREIEQLRAKASQGDEAVEVVGWRHFGDKTRLLCDLGKQRSVPGHYADEFTVPLMTVAQHQRILAAATHPADQVAEPDTELVELLREARELIEHGDFREGHCMCGSAVEAHGFGDGHSPVDAGVYYAGQVMERIDALLAKSEVVKK